MSLDLDRIDILAEFVYAHAVQHYNDNFGWSVIVECWDHDLIVDRLVECKAQTQKQAIAAFAPLVDVWGDQYADAVNSAF